MSCENVGIPFIASQNELKPNRKNTQSCLSIQKLKEPASRWLKS